MRSAQALSVVVVLFLTKSLAVFTTLAEETQSTANRTTVTTSGISAGGAMAIQFQFAFSDTIRGCGVIAGLPYMCALGMLPTAFACMYNPSLINVPGLVGLADAAALVGNIDPVANLQKTTAVLWSGQGDTVVDHRTMIKVAEMFSSVDVKRMKTMFNSSSEHAWITNFYGSECDVFGSPFINNCHVDFAGIFFEEAWAGMGITFNATRGVFHADQLREFDQTRYGAVPNLNSLDTVGFVYVPQQCRLTVHPPVNSTRRRDECYGVHSSSKACHVHVNFHGCRQGRAFIGDAYVAHAGLNEWAESNDVIVVYPQIVPQDVVPYNPKGCFDWWGYAGETFALKFGPQMAAVFAMVESVKNKGSI